MKKITFLLLFIFSFLNADISQYFPKLEGRVIDEANLLSPAEKKDIDGITTKLSSLCMENERNKAIEKKAYDRLLDPDCSDDEIIKERLKTVKKNIKIMRIFISNWTGKQK